mgnify:FL=1|jgi:hypothetical protein|tara:strand:+ start:173 stop:664 length:492 start_codon:yes stop_codon:yes gene_type:complete
MNKKEIHDAITKALLNRFKTAELAAKQAHQAATGDESVAENKYDTFGLEASYLAHGQSQRVIECEQDWLLFSKKALHLHRIDHPVTLWTLVELEALNSALSGKKYFFISPCAGGLSVEVSEKSIFSVTASSPVGKALIGKMVDDEVCLTKNGHQVAYEITSIQ